MKKSRYRNNRKSLILGLLFCLLLALPMLAGCGALVDDSDDIIDPTLTPDIPALIKESCKTPWERYNVAVLIPPEFEGKEITINVEVTEIGVPSIDPNMCEGVENYREKAWTDAGWAIADKGLMYSPAGELVIEGTTYALARDRWLNGMLYPIKGAHQFMGKTTMKVGTDKVLLLPVRNAGALHVTISPVGETGETALNFPAL